ncbi:DNA double-strand break repair nuclease NurA [Patescibacteria group bacterium]|nr:DNA double-strand break repair nuclease NurA [Patescibacteria group bacterium]
MPYEGEFANKTAHVDILNNPDIKRMLSECEYLKPPSDKEAQQLADQFTDPPEIDDDEIPEFVIAIDGSNHEVSIDDKLPSTKFGFIKVGVVLISLKDFGDLKVGNFVDPFRVAALNNKNTSLSFFVPSANINWQDQGNVRDSFRALFDKQLYDERTRFKADDPQTSLRSTLFALGSLRPGEMGTGDDEKLKIHKCPNCGEGPITVEDVPDQQFCPHCQKEIYPTDCLRLWEEVNDFQSNQIVISRMMMILEHIIPAHYIRYFLRESPLLLTNMAFFVDGPLAVFGNAAWLHRSLMTFLENAKRKLSRFNAKPILMIGLQKTGQVVDYINFVDRFLPRDKIYCLDDEFRYKYMLGNRDPAGKTFGFETYYGQDFIYKTSSGKTFDFLIPYPYASKEMTHIDFKLEKTKCENYENLPRAIALINYLESDLYKNAVVPIALAHRFTSISFEPGGRVLDVFARQSIGGQNNG